MLNYCGVTEARSAGISRALVPVEKVLACNGRPTGTQCGLLARPSAVSLSVFFCPALRKEAGEAFGIVRDTWAHSLEARFCQASR